MIDLHIHTQNSDGTDTVEEVLKKAEKLNLKYISITDHETCHGHMQLRNMDVKKYFSGKIIPGIEIKSYYNKRTIDILGYNIDIDKMQSWIDEFYKDKSHADVQKRYLSEFYKTCKELNLTMVPIDEIKWNPDKDWAARTIYREMKSFPENKEKLPQDLWDDYDVFRHRYCYNTENIFYIDRSKNSPSLKETVNAIKNAGGYAFFAHAFLYKWAEDKEKFINDVVDNYGLDGIECFYSRFTDEQTNYMLNLCKSKNLYMSGGSDYHGANRPEVSLGVGQGNLKIPDSIVEQWYKNV